MTHTGRMMPSSRTLSRWTTTAATVVVAAGVTGSSPHEALLLDWAGALSGVESGGFQELRPVPPDNIVQAGLATLEDDQRGAADIDRYRPEQLLVAVKSWEPPMADLADFLRGLQAVQHCTLYLVPLPGHAVSDLSLKDWGDFARELPFRVSSAQALECL